MSTIQHNMMDDHVVLDELRVQTLFYHWCTRMNRDATSGTFDVFKRHLGLGILLEQQERLQTYRLENTQKWMLAKIQYGI